MSPPDDRSLWALWQSGAAEIAPLPIAEIKRRAGKLSDSIARRNRREYIAVGIVVIVFALYAIFLPGSLLKIGSLLVGAGAIFVGWQLARRSSRPDPDAEAADVRTYYRARLVTEEHMLARVGRWYLAPLIPGLAVFLAGIARVANLSPLSFAILVAAHALVFLGIWWLNRRTAAMLRDQIARIDDTPASQGDS
jgi:hypothetical protein